MHIDWESTAHIVLEQISMENIDALQAIARGEKPDQETLLKLKDERLVDIANVTHMQSSGQ